MSNSVSPLPPDDLIRAIFNGSCIPFIGAGVAHEARVALPDGANLALSLLPECRRLDATFNIESHQNIPLPDIAEEFVRLVEHRRHGQGRNELLRFIEKLIPSHIAPPQPGVSSYPFLVNIPWQPNPKRGPVIITTNWDLLLEQACSTYSPRANTRVVNHQAAVLLEENNPRFKLIKFHGSVDDPSNLVITRTDYNKSIQRIQEHHSVENQVARFFAGKTMLLIGYSLDDPDFNFMLEWLASALPADRYPNQPTHYVVSGETPDAAKVTHYRDLGFELIPSNARPFLRALYIETNGFINRDRARKLSLVETRPLATIIGYSGVGKSFLLERIEQDLIQEKREHPRNYTYFFRYTLPTPDNLLPESRAMHLLQELAPRIGMAIPRFDARARQRAQESNQPEDEVKWQLILESAGTLTSGLTLPTLLLFDSTGDLHPRVLQVLELLCVPALTNANLNVIFASRAQPTWNNFLVGRQFKKNTLRLDPFHAEEIGQWIRFQSILEADRGYEDADTSQIATAVIRLTRGHPGAIKHVMHRISEEPTRWRNARDVLIFLEQSQKTLLTEILENLVKPLMLEGVEDELRDIIIDGLCILREMNADTLDAFAKRLPGTPLQKWVEKNKSEYIINRLKKLNLAQDAEWYAAYAVLDPVVRGLLASYMEAQNPGKFFLLNRHALDAWRGGWDSMGGVYQQKAISEALYHGIHAVRQDFAEQDKAFARLLDLLDELTLPINPLPSPNDRSGYFRNLCTLIDQDDLFREEFCVVFDNAKYNSFMARLGSK